MPIPILPRPCCIASNNEPTSDSEAAPGPETPLKERKSEKPSEKQDVESGVTPGKLSRTPSGGGSRRSKKRPSVGSASKSGCEEVDMTEGAEMIVQDNCCLCNWASLQVRRTYFLCGNSGKNAGFFCLWLGNTAGRARRR